MHFALATAAVFAMQTFNVTVVPHASSGHLIGGFLLASWFGPLYALLGMAMVLATQSLLFADGGLAAWGLNSVLMGVIPAVVVFSLVKHFAGAHANKLSVKAGASWLSVVLAALVCAICMYSRVEAREQAGSWMASMLGVHALIGIVEAAVTVSLLAVVARIAKLNWSIAMQSVVSCIAMAGIVIIASFGASPWPDGLEYNLQRLGIEALPSIENTLAPWPDYSSLVGTLAGNLILLATAAAVVFVLSSLTSKKVSD
jgi:cobalt/nickel transport system permease protein